MSKNIDLVFRLEQDQEAGSNTVIALINNEIIYSKDLYNIHDSEILEDFLSQSENIDHISNGFFYADEFDSRYEAHEKRLIMEHKRVQSDYQKLYVFTMSDFFRTLPGDEKNDQLNQARVMFEYKNLLESRINRFMTKYK